MAKVCYEIEQDKYKNVILWQITPEKRRYMKISLYSMAWIVQQFQDILLAQKRSEELPYKAKVAEISKAQKMADFLYKNEGKNVSNSN